MKAASRCLICLIVAMSASAANADDWMLRVQGLARVCHVQLKTASPLGSDLKGPFPTRKATCVEAKNQYDPGSSDQTKCWSYGTVAACKADGVDLPK